MAVNNKSNIHKFSSQTNITKSGYSKIGNVNFLTTATTIELISTSANDALAGSHARKVIIEGIDVNYNLITETINTNGTSVSSTSTNSFIRVYEARITEVGTYGNANDGTITIRVSSGGSTLLTILPGNGASRSSLISTSKDDYLYIYSISLSTTNSPQDVRLYERRNYNNTVSNIKTIKIIKEKFRIEKDIFRFDPPLRIPPYSDFWIEGKSNGAPSSIDIDTYFKILPLTIDFQNVKIDGVRSSAYSELITTQLEPVYNIKGLYDNVNTRTCETFVSGAGSSVTNNDSLFSITCGTGLGNYATLRSKRHVNYQPGTANVHRFSAIFDTPVANYWQLAGAGVSGNGLFVGYGSSGDFSVIRQTAGEGEQRKLTINVAENTSATATITLNGTAFNISLTNAGGSTQFTAYELTENGTFTGWSTNIIGNEITFVSDSTGTKSGTYSYSSTGASTGTFTQLAAGVADSYTFISQDSFNKDKVDGNGDSNMIIDPQKGNVYEIKFKWLGFGNMDFYVENPSTGVMVLMHSIQYPNLFTEVSITKPVLKSTFAVYSAGGTGSTQTLKVGSFGAFVEGMTDTTNLSIWSVVADKSISSNTETNILVLRSTGARNNNINYGELILKEISIAVDGTKNVIIRIYLNGTIGGGTTTDFYNYLSVNSESVAIYDTTSETISGGILLASFVVSKSGSLDITTLQDIEIYRLDTLTVTAESTGASDVFCSINWVENL